MFFGKTINKVNVFHDWNFGNTTGQILEEKTINFVIFLLRTFVLVSGIYDTWKLSSYQNLGNARLILKKYIKNTLFLTFILKQYFIFYKIFQKSLQFFDLFHSNQWNYLLYI